MRDQSFLELSTFKYPFLSLGDFECLENTCALFFGLNYLKSTLMSCGMLATPPSLSNGCYSLNNSSFSSTMDPLIEFLII